MNSQFIASPIRVKVLPINPTARKTFRTTASGVPKFWRGQVIKLFWKSLPAVFGLLLISGCAPRFHYTPRHDAAYASGAKFRGVQIERGEGEPMTKPEGEISWSKTDSQIVANALADEIKYSKLFRPVDVVKSADASRRKDKYSHTIEFNLRKFRLHPEDNFGQKVGRTALKYLGPRGYFIGKGIPRKWVSEVEIEFQLRDARSGDRIFSKVYSATPRSVSVSGYAGAKEPQRQMSEALEEVVKAFVRDLAKLPAAQHD